MVNLLTTNIQDKLKVAVTIATADNLPIGLLVEPAKPATIFVAGTHVRYWADVGAKADEPETFVLPLDMAKMLLALKKGKTITLTNQDGLLHLESEGVTSETPIIGGFVFDEKPKLVQRLNGLQRLLAPSVGTNVGIASDGDVVFSVFDDEVRVVMVQEKEQLPQFSVLLNKAHVDFVRRVVTGPALVSLRDSLFTASCNDAIVAIPYETAPIDKMPPMSKKLGELGPELTDFLRLSKEPQTHIYAGLLESEGQSRIRVEAPRVSAGCDVWLTTNHIDPRTYGLKPGVTIGETQMAFSVVILTDGTTSVYLAPHVEFKV